MHAFAMRPRNHQRVAQAELVEFGGHHIAPHTLGLVYRQE